MVVAPATPAAAVAVGHGLLRVEHAQGLRALARAEALALGARAEVAPGLFVLDGPPPAGRAGLALSGGVVVAAGPPDGPLAPAWDDLAEVSVVRAPCTDERRHPIRLLRRLGSRARVARGLGSAFELYATPAGCFLVAAVDVRHAEPALVHRTSESLPARVARAVVNLVARPGERVVDPVCGTGVLLVEAARAGCAVEGADANWRAVHAARANLAALGLAGVARVVDALAAPGPPGPAPTDPPAPAHDALVGDLPYGFGLVPQDLTPFAAALPPRARRWALVAHVDLSPALAAAGHAPREVLRVPKPRFTRFVHLGGEGLPPGVS